MVDARFKLKMGSPKGIFDRELDAEHKDSTFIRAFFRSKDTGLPDEHIISLRAGAAAEGWILS
jgi:hypothetical protein